MSKCGRGMIIMGLTVNTLWYEVALRRLWSNVMLILPLLPVISRCGLLTFHIVLPYSFLQYPFVEAAIRATYQKNICNCSVSYNTQCTHTHTQMLAHNMSVGADRLHTKLDKAVSGEICCCVLEELLFLACFAAPKWPSQQNYCCSEWRTSTVLMSI